MLPAPQQQVINNELSGTDLASAKLQITQTAPIRIASEIVRLSISEETLEGCTMEACEEAKKAGLKGTVILAGTKINPGLSIFQLFTEEAMKSYSLTTSQGSMNAESAERTSNLDQRYRIFGQLNKLHRTTEGKISGRCRSD